MSVDPNAQMARLRELCPAAELWMEGGKPAAFLPGLMVEVGKTLFKRDALLWPHERDSYSSRLFLSEPVSAPNAKNWKESAIAGRTWHVCSWQGVPNTLPWIEMLANHLRAFR